MVKAAPPGCAGLYEPFIPGGRLGDRSKADAAAWTRAGSSRSAGGWPLLRHASIEL